MKAVEFCGPDCLRWCGQLSCDRHMKFSGARIVADGLYSYVIGAVVHATIYWALSGAVWHAVEAGSWAHGWAGADASPSEARRTHARVVFVFGSTIVHEVLYLGMNGFFSACDAYGWLRRFKLPRRPAQVPSPELLRSAWREAAVRHLLLQPLSFWFLVFPAYEAMCADDGLVGGAPPAWTTAFWQLLACTVWIDLTFYIIHRAFHTPWLYKRFHRQHHRFTGTVGVRTHCSCLTVARLTCASTAALPLRMLDPLWRVLALRPQRQCVQLARWRSHPTLYRSCRMHDAVRIADGVSHRPCACCACQWAAEFAHPVEQCTCVCGADALVLHFAQ